MKNNQTFRKERKKTANPVKAPKSPEVTYRRKLNVLVRSMQHDINTRIVPILKQYEGEYVNDAYATVLEEAFDSIRLKYSGINRNAKVVSNSFVTSTDQSNKKRFYKAMGNAVGIDLHSVVQNEGLSDTLIATTRENVALIRSIPEEYFKKIETIVFTGTTQGNRPSSMIKEIMKTGRTTHKRAKLIARDQTSKLNSALNQQRQQNLGIEEYVWRTAGDGRVRDNHASKNGKIFKWSNPPKDTGNPGEDIQCRCIAQPIFKI